MTRRLSWMLPVIGICWSTTSAQAQTTSSALARELVDLLQQKQLTVVAARLPDEPGRFAAALYIPQRELLTVSARYSVPVLLQEKVYLHKYHDAYTSLNGAGDKAGKLFVEDLGADGLARQPTQAGTPDLIYQEIARRTLLNGDWKGQQLREGEYTERFTSAETEYVRALTALIAELKKAT